MNATIEIKEMPKLDLAFVTQIGVEGLGNAYAKLMQWAAPKGLLTEDSKMVTIYHDSFKITEPDKVRMSACLILKEKTKSSIEIIKVFSILDTFDFEILKPFEPLCDYFLFDTKGKLPGGNGTTFNWKVLENYPTTKPFFLSGGIGIEELEQVKQVLKSNLPIYAIDINSKFENEPGLKNIKLCKDAINRLSTK